jgi:hypothetical protein
VRISGGDAERLSTVARHAADAGLEVWFYPFPGDLGGVPCQPPQGAIPDEDEQVRYLNEPFDVFEEEDVIPRCGSPSPTTTSPAPATSPPTAPCACSTRPDGNRSKVFHAMSTRHQRPNGRPD